MAERAVRPGGGHQEGPSRPRPSHWSGEYGAWFQDPQIAAVYHHRPPYPAAVIDTLAALLPQTQRTVLDVGCGTGDLARRLAPLVERVDAVDFSAPMLERGRGLPGGDHPHLRWIGAAVETAPLAPPYGLVTAGESLHWMDWDVVLPRFAQALAPGGLLAIAERAWDGPPALRERLRPIFVRYSPVRNFQPTDLLAELQQRRLFAPAGERHCAPQPWRPTVEAYLACRHSQRGFSRTHMGPQATAAFDGAVRDALGDLIREGLVEPRHDRLQLQVEARVTWGRPRRPPPPTPGARPPDAMPSR